MTTPFQQITGPQAGRYAYGLQSVAQVVDVVGENQKDFWAGVQWDTDCPVMPMSAMDDDICDPRADKVLDDPPTVNGATPLRGYAGLFCKLPGREDLLSRARAAFDLVEWPFLEEQAVSGVAGNTPFLAAASVNDVTPVPGTAVPLETAIGLLDQWLVLNLGTLGTIWSPRLLSGWWARNGLMTTTGGVAYDPMQNKIMFGANVGTPGPNAVAAAAGAYWLFATGPVQVRRSEVFEPRLDQALNRAENEVFGLVERQYLILWSCDAAGVLVNPLLPPQA